MRFLTIFCQIRSLNYGAMVSDKENFSYGNARRVVIDVLGNGMISHVDGEEFEREGSHFEIEILPLAVSLYRGDKK